MPNDMLVKLNIAFCTLKEVKIKPVYNIGESSKMKVTKLFLVYPGCCLSHFLKDYGLNICFAIFTRFFCFIIFRLVLGHFYHSLRS